MMIHYLLSLFFCWTEKSGNWQVSGSFNNDSNKPVPHFVAHFSSIKKKGKIFENSKRFIQSDSEKYAPANISFVDLLKKKLERRLIPQKQIHWREMQRCGAGSNYFRRNLFISLMPVILW